MQILIYVCNVVKNFITATNVIQLNVCNAIIQIYYFHITVVIIKDNFEIPLLNIVRIAMIAIVFNVILAQQYANNVELVIIGINHIINV